MVNTVMINFAKKVNEELVKRFLNKGIRTEIYTVTLGYQVDISAELKELLQMVINTRPNIEELENVINEYCEREVIIHICSFSEFLVSLQILKTPPCRM